MLYIEVAIPLPISDTFTYSVPSPLEKGIQVGKRVLVPFKNRKVTGYVLEKRTHTGVTEIKEILEVIDPEPLFHPEMVSFFKWISHYYLCPIGQVIHSALPSGIEPIRIRNARLTTQGLDLLGRLGPHAPAYSILEWIKENPGKALKYSYSQLKPLIDKGWIQVEERLRKGRAILLRRRFVKIKDGIGSWEELQKRIGGARAKNEEEFLRTVLKKGPIMRSELTRLFSNASYLIQKWVKKDILELFEGPVLRNPLGGLELPSSIPEKLFPQQSSALAELEAHLDKGGFLPCLLYGVTGSGKTEVYFRAIEMALDKGMGAIFMAPEIALASYLAGLFKARFDGEIALYHSGLSEGERYEQWIRMARGEVMVVFGARSAVFAPLPRLGLIIVDEEHDPSYKQDVSPRYHGRDAAVMRGRLQGAVVLLGSGTPSVQSFHNAKEGRYGLIEMPYRIEQRPFPRVEVVDMKEVYDPSTGGILTPKLVEAMAQSLDDGGQCILFLNRRGFHRMVLCCSCGEALRCPNCDVALVHHRHEDELRCHYCGYGMPSVEQCPGCKSMALKAFGFGTQRLEEEVRKLFPTATIQRMDADITGRKRLAYNTIRSFGNREIDILLGTQMITKGYDFPGVTLVGVVAADLSLCFPDFRAAERTFQLLSQVAGRAGRGDKKGRVIIQTFNPQHYAIVSAIAYDYEGFYEKERALREQLGYPPFTYLICVRVQGNLKERTEEAAQDLAARLSKTLSSWPTKGPDLKVLGPAKAPISKLRGKYRWQILLKASQPALGQYLLREVERITRRGLKYKGVAVIFDVDPYQMT